MRCGLAWEALEREYLRRFLAAPALTERVRPAHDLDLTVTDTYAPGHWALTGQAPAYDTPDEDVYLVGRNVLLLSKTAVYCALHGIERIAVGPLAGNPFPDATPGFFAALATALSMGLDRRIVVDAPFARHTKEDVVRLGGELGVPLEHTLSCMSPAGGLHCGRCSKCRERVDAFAAVGRADSRALRPPSSEGRRPRLTRGLRPVCRSRHRASQVPRWARPASMRPEERLRACLS